VFAPLYTKRRLIRPIEIVSEERNVIL